MKRVGLVSLVALLAIGCGSAPPPAPVAPPPPPPVIVEAPPPPPPGDPAPVVDGEVTVASVHGIKVVIRKIPGAEFVAAQLSIRGGVRNWDEKTAGLENLALAVAANGGTQTLDKTAFLRKLASLGADLGASAANDYSSVYAKAPRAALDDTFRLMADAFLAPAMPATELEIQRQQALASLHHEDEDPDGRLWTLQRKQVFAGHPYANRPIGTLESVASFKIEDLTAHLAKLRETSRFLITVVGDVDDAHVIELVSGAFGQVPAGSYVETPLPPLSFDKGRLTIEERKLPTNYVSSVFLAPTWQDPDFMVAQVAASGLSHRLMDEIRTRRNLTYSVNAYIQSSVAEPFGNMTVSAVDANTAMKAMLDEVRKLQTQPLPDAELAGFKSVFLTWYLEGKQYVDGQAAALAAADILGGDWHLAKTIPDRVRAVTKEDVQAFAKKYMTHLQQAVVGDKSKIDPTLFTSF